MAWRAVSPLLSLAVLLLPLRAGAKLCGDDVHGQDVPCACGDVVVSDVVLGDDPVVQAPCANDGLTVRATGAVQGVTVDLAGKRLQGTGHGIGVWVLYGGPGGARVVSTGSRATVAGFFDGIVARGAESVALVDGVVVADSKRDGVQVDAPAPAPSLPGYVIQNTEARDSGRDGFSVGGSGFQLTATRAVNSRRYGYWVMGQGGTLTAPVAEGSGDDGIGLMGMGQKLEDCVVSGSEEDGVHFWGMHFLIRGCTARGNGGDGINGMGMEVVLAGNQATDNDNNGIVVGGGWGVDWGGNSGSENRGRKQHRPVAQCEISGHPCLP